MKKKWIRILAFWLILLCMVTGLSVGLEVIANTHSSTVHEHLKVVVGIKKEKAQTIDALILGDSLSYTTISSIKLWETYGIPTYSCGQSGQNLIESYEILKQVYKTQTPKVVLLETHMIYQIQDGAGAWNDAINYWCTYNLPFWQFHDLWKSLLFNTKYTQEGYKGYIIRDNISPYYGEPYMIDNGQEEALPTYGKCYMEKIRKLCEAHGTTLILFSAPSPMNYYYMMHRGLQSYADSQQLTYMDFNLMIDQLGIDWMRDSLDGGDHLNLYGTNKVTAYVGQELMNMGLGLKDKRQDEAYSDWQEVLAAYKAEEAVSLMK